jgi:hypothetical protein
MMIIQSCGLDYHDNFGYKDTIFMQKNGRSVAYN